MIERDSRTQHDRINIRKNTRIKRPISAFDPRPLLLQFQHLGRFFARIHDQYGMPLLGQKAHAGQPGFPHPEDQPAQRRLC